MIIPSLLTVVLASLVGTSFAQGSTPIVYDSIHNATVIVGTWSSGSKAVQTGSGFAAPANMTFNYPKTTGISYSFSADGFYEIARYRFNSNGSEPTCITGVIGWVHGTYTLNTNGSISMVPLGDGFQQIQDPCAANSNFVESYNLTEYYQSWRIFQDPTQGFKLHMFQFDGSPLAPQFLVSATPNMLPTENLLTAASSSSVSRRSEPEPVTTSNAPEALGRHWTKSAISAGVLVLVSATVSLL
ncbi:hypothetical protein HYPSUDRAFT_137963 [Hypholoma sublateritium FD-334 SS-4]|uniref:Protein ROT1 n=1 Tax=Hypholoma sublateritium (strain FD-334 SS-4) TaxID=945553 RepID=A0A0D2PUL9_HYPSF|nr:hypothetical protein HYPSUDRAFT_137963 [Hypholoma sublateritium FD-334 SS-4]